MDHRSLLIGLGVLLSGIVLGVALVIGIRGLDQRGYEFEDERAEAVVPRVPQAPRASAVQIGNPDPEPPLAVPELTTLNYLFKGVAARVTPTVVFIEVESPTDARTREFEEAHPFLQPRRFRRSAGSGVIVSEAGHVVTNAHVIHRASRIRVLLNDKREYDAELVGSDPTTDIAVIRLPDATSLPVATIGDARALEVGEWVMAIGNPFRLTSTVTAGIVSALGRQVDIIDDAFRIEDFIQTDAAINPGNSGGALVNLRGELIGIATAIATEGGSYEGYGFAVPIDLVTRVATDLIEFGEVQRGYLGVSIRNITAEDARRLGLERIRGVVVDELSEAGAAAAAGLRVGDVLLAVDGYDVDATNQFQSAIALRRPGDLIRLTVWRRGGLRDFEARLVGRDDEAFRAWASQVGGRTAPPPAPDRRDERPPGEMRLYEPEPWGIGLRDLASEEMERFGVDAGAFVVYVRPGGPAAADGLPPRAVITEIEGEPVTDAGQAAALLERVARDGETALVRVRRPDGLTAFYDLESPDYIE
jgi:serine protease Do